MEVQCGKEGRKGVWVTVGVCTSMYVLYSRYSTGTFSFAYTRFVSQKQASGQKEKTKKTKKKQEDWQQTRFFFFFRGTV